MVTGYVVNNSRFRVSFGWKKIFGGKKKIDKKTKKRGR